MKRINGRTDSIADAFEGLRQDYSAAKASRYRRRRVGVSATGSGADYHYRNESDYLRIIEEARDMDRNDIIVGQTVERAVDNIVQEGFSLDANTGDAALDDELEARWKDWSQDPDQCDVSGENCFYDMERLALRSKFIDGDHIVLATDTGALQLIEAHRVRTPRNTNKNVVLGVLLDQFRRRLEYWITKDDIDPIQPVSRVSDVQAYPTRDSEGNRQVFHIYTAKRPSQTRGISDLAPIFDACGMFEDINFAKLVQQQTVSCFAVFRSRGFESRGLPSIDQQYGVRTTDTLSGGASRRIEGIAPGMEIIGEPGEKLEGFSPSVPNAEFFDHVRLILQLIGINLGMPLVLALMDASETNYSGWRGAVDEARKGFRRNQKWFAERFHIPAYRWKVRQWLSDDPAMRSVAAKSGIDVFGHKWNPPRWPYIQPSEDIAADLMQIRGLLGSPRKVHANRGDNYYETVDESISDNRYAIESAKQVAAEINARYPDNPVHWREVVSLPTPEGITLQIGGPNQNQNQGQNPAKTA